MIAGYTPTCIHLLVVGNAVVGLCFCGYAATEGQIAFVLSYLPILPHLAMIVSQACLLAIWALLGTGPMGLRVAGFLSGVVYLEVVAYLGTGDDDFFWLATFSASLVAFVLGISRIWLAPLAQLGSEALPSSPATFQFSIKGLMLLTLAVAVSITVAKVVNAYLGGPRFLVDLLLWVATIGVTGLASVWAMLTAAVPGPRAAMVLAIAIGSAALTAYGFNEGWDTYFYLITITVLQASVVLLSLLVVRSCGFRLRRRFCSPVKDGFLDSDKAKP